ncbi:MAG: flavodoxin family protein [Chloroflexi bacterium]|nr:flavodoxin family protein [Chloroflexota bacterium]
MGDSTVLGLVGSPNRNGKTNQLVTAALEGAADRGARVELVQMADHVVNACKDCLPSECEKNLKCTYEDASLEYLTQKILTCGALVLGSPVYWSETSGMVKFLMIKMTRIYARTAPLKGVPTLGFAVAGGSGNGLVSGLRPLYHFFQTMQMRAIGPVPSTRFNLNSALQRSRELGAELTGMVGAQQPFAGLEERLAWYDSLPYLDLNRTGERRLLAGIITAELGDNADLEMARGLAKADALLAEGRQIEALAEITRVYETGIKDWGRR